MKEFFYIIIEFLPAVIVGFVVYFIMRSKCNLEIKQAYFKGQEDYQKMIPESEAHLDKLTKEFTEASHKDWNSHKVEYRIGLIDGSKYIYEKKGIGEYTSSDAVDVLKSNRYRPYKFMHWSESDYYDEIIEAYQLETGDTD